MMAPIFESPTISIVPYVPSQYRAVLQFCAQQLRTHHHLDWRQINEWLRDEYDLTLVASQRGAIVGVISFAAPKNGTTWLRLASLQDDASPLVLHNLLAAGQSLCQARGIHEIAVLEMDFWLQALLEQNGFVPLDRIVHLIREVAPAPEFKLPDFKICSVHRHDLSIIETIDNAAFPPLWQMALADFRETMHYATSFTMAVVEKHVVGYQLSTSYTDAIHLARLATWPSAQKRGIGRALVEHLIHQFPRRPITVNTQASNLAARHIYENLGFTTQKMPTAVWHLLLS
jgi:GNAT superfamily N-acetyltransferase